MSIAKRLTMFQMKMKNGNIHKSNNLCCPPIMNLQVDVLNFYFRRQSSFFINSLLVILQFLSFFVQIKILEIVPFFSFSLRFSYIAGPSPSTICQKFLLTKFPKKGPSMNLSLTKEELMNINMRRWIDMQRAVTFRV